MRARWALLASLLLGLAILVPVLLVVGLGAFGAAKGGSISAVSPQGSSLQLIPAAGPPGTQVSIYGRGWTPRQSVRLDLQVPKTGAQSQDGLSVGLGQVLTSRSGDFNLSVTLPTMALPAGPATVNIVAAHADGNSRLAAEFQIERAANLLGVEVVYQGRRQPGVRVDLHNSFGEAIDSALTGADGTVQFAGIPPGTVRIRGLALDHDPVQASARITSDSEDRIRLELREPVPSRLVIPDPDNPRRFALSSIEIDRRSGLVTARQQLADPDDRRRRPVAFIYQLPAAGFGQPELSAINAISWQLPNYYYFNSGFVLYLGNNGTEDFVFAHDNAFQRRRVLYVYDRSSESIAREIVLGPSELTPVVNPAGTQIYVLDWEARTVKIYDPAGDFAVRTISNLPELISAFTLDTRANTLWMSSALTNRLTPLHLQEGLVGDPITFARDLIVMSFDPDRRRIYGVNYKQPEIAMIDLDSGQVRFAQIQSPALWIWPDPEGSLLFAAVDLGKSLQVLDKDSLETVAVHAFGTPS